MYISTDEEEPHRYSIPAMNIERLTGTGLAAGGWRLKEVGQEGLA
jgi:hypothetical protein